MYKNGFHSRGVQDQKDTELPFGHLFCPKVSDFFFGLEWKQNPWEIFRMRMASCHTREVNLWDTVPAERCIYFHTKGRFLLYHMPEEVRGGKDGNKCRGVDFSVRLQMNIVLIYNHHWKSSNIRLVEQTTQSDSNIILSDWLSKQLNENSNIFINVCTGIFADDCLFTLVAILVNSATPVAETGKWAMLPRFPHQRHLVPRLSQ